jgi:hypothetical protein
VERKHVRIHDLAGMEKLARHNTTGCHSSDQQA